MFVRERVYEENSRQKYKNTEDQSLKCVMDILSPEHIYDSCPTQTRDLAGPKTFEVSYRLTDVSRQGTNTFEGVWRYVWICERL